MMARFKTEGDSLTGSADLQGFKELALIQIKYEHPSLNFFGYINEDMLKKHIKDFSKPIYYIVGPQVMVDTMNEILIKLGVKSGNIKLERFG